MTAAPSPEFRSGFNSPAEFSPTNNREHPTAEGVASLAMYPFPALADAWERLYAFVAGRVDGAPRGLRWDLAPHEAWRSPQLAVAMACGWPVATILGDIVRVVGAFSFTVDDDPPACYRSVIVARTPAQLDDMLDIPAAINEPDSLSGSVSLLRAAGLASFDEWPGGSVRTGAHVASIAAVRDGRAGVASIDAVTWAYLERDESVRLAGLTVIDRGPLVPTLPIVVPAGASDDEVSAWRVAFAAAIHEPSLTGVRAMLLIRGFVPLEFADYLGLAHW